jgi:hypothetical protein
MSTAFSVIFDLSYGGDFNFSRFIDEDQEKSYVEVVLYQSDENASLGNTWVSV